MASSKDDGISLGGYKIPALTGKENYRSWKSNVKDILEDMDLLPHIEKSLDDLIAAKQSDEEKIRKSNKKATMNMRIRCDQYVQTFIESVCDAKEAWEILRNEYEDSGSITRIYLRRQFYSIRMSEEDDLTVHHLKLRQIYQDLRVARDPLPESEFAMTLITSLQLISRILQKRMIKREWQQLIQLFPELKGKPTAVNHKILLPRPLPSIQPNSGLIQTILNRGRINLIRNAGTAERRVTGLRSAEKGLRMKKRGVQRKMLISHLTMEMVHHHLHLERVCILEILGSVIPVQITI